MSREASRRWRARHPEKRREMVRRYRAEHPEKTLEYGRRSDQLRYANGRHAARYARQIMRGDQIRNTGNHHTGMAKLKMWMGDPRPAGLTLSRVCLVNCPQGYEGYASSPKRPYRLCTNPLHYRWESWSENHARKVA